MSHIFKDPRIAEVRAKTGKAMWAEIDNIVTGWAKRNPQGANYNRLYNQQIRDDLANEKGTWKQEFSGKHGKVSAQTGVSISVHPELVTAIEAFFPDFFASKENVRKFGHTYKMFKIPREYQ